LRRIGKIVSAVADGHFLASVDFVPRLGDRLYNSGGMVLGQVDDVLGPVSAPLLLIRPLRGGHLLNSPVFLSDKNHPERKS
jgi:rRNA processing protein Gar1